MTDHLHPAGQPISTHLTRREVLLAPLVVITLLNSTARAQSGWPGRPVKWVLSQPAGSGPDILARFLADQLSKTWAQPVVIENRPGGQNVIGAQAPARAAPDAYTFYYATTAAIITNSFTFKSLPYDPVKDFMPIRLIGRSPFVLAAGPAFKGSSLADAIAAAKAEPGGVTIASEGPKTFSGMLADAIAAMAGVKFNHVPFTKASEAIQDAIGGRIALVCLPEAALLSMLRAGQLRALAVSTAQRSANQPNTPVLAETFAGFEYSGWNGLFAPAGTEKEVLAKVNRDIELLLAQAEIAQKLLSLGSIAEPSMSVGGFEQFLAQERDRWAKMVRAIGVVAE